MACGKHRARKRSERAARAGTGALVGLPPTLPAAERARLADEVGDLLFVLANLARKLALNPEECLRAANAKFARRFGAVEASLARDGRTPADATLDEMEAAWQAAKAAERA